MEIARGGSSPATVARSHTSLRKPIKMDKDRGESPDSAMVAPIAPPLGLKDGDFVKSLARGLLVIRSFDDEHHVKTLSEVARRTGLSRAQRAGSF